MTDRPRKPRSGPATPGADLDTALGGLLGTLGSALSEMLARLDEGGSGTVSRAQEFETAHGPIRAQAGIRIRMGGHDVAGDAAPTPVNAGRTRTATAHAPAPEPAPRDLAYDLFEEPGRWHLTADMPGVQRKDLAVRATATGLMLEAKGARAYRAEIALDAPADVAGITMTLRNGILDMTIPKGGAA